MVETLKRGIETAGKLTSPAGEVDQTRTQTSPEIILLSGPMQALAEAEAGREARIIASSKRIQERASMSMGTID